MPEYCIFHGLLLSWSTVYNEAISLLYRADRSVIRYCDPRSLEPLRNLTPLALSNFTNLKVILNEASRYSRDSWVRLAELEENANHAAIDTDVDGINPNPRLGLPRHDEVISGSDWEVKVFSLTGDFEEDKSDAGVWECWWKVSSTCD